jgi:hypothetical protein
MRTPRYLVANHLRFKFLLIVNILVTSVKTARLHHDYSTPHVQTIINLSNLQAKCEGVFDAALIAGCESKKWQEGVEALEGIIAKIEGDEDG